MAKHNKILEDLIANNHTQINPNNKHGDKKPWKQQLKTANDDPAEQNRLLAEKLEQRTRIHMTMLTQIMIDSFPLF